MLIVNDNGAAAGGGVIKEMVYLCELRLNLRLGVWREKMIELL